jgi:hypothetical protein
MSSISTNNFVNNNIQTNEATQNVNANIETEQAATQQLVSNAAAPILSPQGDQPFIFNLEHTGALSSIFSTANKNIRQVKRVKEESKTNSVASSEFKKAKKAPEPSVNPALQNLSPEELTTMTRVTGRGRRNATVDAEISAVFSLLSTADKNNLSSNTKNG